MERLVLAGGPFLVSVDVLLLLEQLEDLETGA